MQPLVSILIPAFNAERWIAQTIDSALAQTWERKEIIVVDDGSTDNTYSVACGFQPRGVTVLRQSNQGAAAARNTAFAASHGSYIQWLDADDLLAANKIENQLKARRPGDDSRTLLSGPWGRFFYRTEKAQFIPTPLWCDLSPAEWLRRKMAYGCHMQTATWLVSRELTEAAGPWNTRLLGDDDGEYFCRVKLASNRIRFVPDARTYYRETGSARLSYIGRSRRKLDAQFLSMQLHIRYLRSLQDDDRTRSACVSYLQKYMFDFYLESSEIMRQMQDLAAELGGQLLKPKSSWKYLWIEKVLGWHAAKRAQLSLPQIKTSFIRRWDRLAFHFKKRELSARLSENLHCPDFRDLMWRGG